MVENQQIYTFSFSRRALLLNESCLIAELYAQINDWTEVRLKTVEGNLLQTRTVSTSRKLTSELVSRLKTLTESQLRLLVQGTVDERRALLWLALCKRYKFLRDIGVELLREKFLRADSLLTAEDYEHFFNIKADWHPELDKLNAATRKNIKQTFMQILREARLLTNEDQLLPANLSSRLVEIIRAESSDLLHVFPVSDASLKELVG